ncbi:unnamed protein product, partial [Polarella glacialis]
VLELGCGAAALPSLAAAASLGARVTATDFGEIVPLLSDSVRRNSAALRLDPGAHVDVASYAWSESQAPPGSPYDLVLAADLLYDESCQVALVSAILAALGSDSGTLLMTYEERDARVEARFFGLLKEKSSATSIPLALPPPAVSGPAGAWEPLSRMLLQICAQASGSEVAGVGAALPQLQSLLERYNTSNNSSNNSSNSNNNNSNKIDSSNNNNDNTSEDGMVLASIKTTSTASMASTTASTTTATTAATASRLRDAELCKVGERRLLLAAMAAMTSHLVQLLSQAASPVVPELADSDRPMVLGKFREFSDLSSELGQQWVRFATAAFLCLYGKLGHSCAEDLLRAALEAPVSGSVFGERMAFWGRYLAAQFAVTGRVARADATTMLMESTDLRNQVGWSVPTPAAVLRLSSMAPICVRGQPAAAEAWVAALQQAGVEVAEDLASSAGTLLVAWPDLEAAENGPASLSILAAWAGRHLVTVGEWKGSTLGLYPGAAKEWGQAWAPEAQMEVSRCFLLRDSLVLPSWPLACDRFAIYERRGSDET